LLCVIFLQQKVLQNSAGRLFATESVAGSSGGFFCNRKDVNQKANALALSADRQA
jgi:hypothetical protein